LKKGVINAKLEYQGLITEILGFTEN